MTGSGRVSNDVAVGTGKSKSYRARGFGNGRGSHDVEVGAGELETVEGYDVFRCG